MNRFIAGVDAFFLHGRHFGFGHFGVTAFVDERRQLGVIRRRFLRQRMTGGHRQVSGAHKGIRTGGIDGQGVIVTLHIEGDFHAFRAANPVALHRFYGIRPVVQLIQIAQQLVCVSGDFDKPLWDLFTLNFGVATPAAAVDHLFVGENGLIVRAPVNGRSLLVHQAFFIQLGEEFLFPAVVFRGAGRDFTAPVIAKTQRFELVFHVRDVVVRPRRRRGVVLHRRAFRRQAEGVPADWLQHVFAQHTLVAGNHVADGVVTYVAHV